MSLKFEVTILGNNSAYPAHGRYPTSQIVNYNDDLYMVDCGEGAQIRLSAFGIKRSRIDHIFISHLHGDHVFGLPGLINSYAQFSRSAPLHIYGPKGIRLMIDTVLRISASKIAYEVVFHELEATEKVKVLEHRNLKVYAFPMKHRVTTYGYLFAEKKREPNIRKEAIDEYDLSVSKIRALKAGTVSPAQLDLPDEILVQHPRRAYAFCSDTRYDTDLVPQIAGVDLLYHEATFLHDLKAKADESQHSTAFEAGMIARMAEVGELIIGHFSSRYESLELLLQETRDVFPDTRLALEGETFQVGQ